MGRFPSHAVIDRRVQLLFQPVGLVSVPALQSSAQPRQAPQEPRREPAAPHLDEQRALAPADPHLVQTADGAVFVCARHQWASRTVVDPANLPSVCPLCEAEVDERAGRLRYAALHLRLVVGF